MISETLRAETNYDAPRWYAIQTKPREEDRTNFHLMAGNLETFTPKFRERCHNPLTSKPSHKIKHLFPGYIFARFSASRSLHNVTYTRGVRRVVSFGEGPTPICNEIIETIKARAGEDGIIKLGERLERGDEVTVTGGPFKGAVGLFEEQTSDSERVVILLSTISFQPRVTLEKELVQKHAHK
jgi:transcriptional antiterminator RfaH